MTEITFLDTLAALTEEDRTTLMVGRLEDRIETIAAICTRLTSVEVIRVYWVPDQGTVPAGLDAAWSALPTRGDNAAGGTFSPPQEQLVQVATSGLAFYGRMDGRDAAPGDGEGPRPAGLRARCLIPLGPRERIVAVLCAGTFDAAGISTGARHTLMLLAPLFALAIDNARLRKPGPSSQRHDVVRKPQAADGTGPYKADSMARWAHDVKNAMTTISTFMQLLPAKWHDAHFRSSFYPAARDEAMRINRLVNTMLDSARQRNPNHPHVDLHAMLAHLLAVKTPLADQRHLRLRFRDGLSDPTLRIDQDAIEEAIHNLLSNAMEASPEGGRIDIRLEDDILPNGQPAVRLEIQDRGPGVDEALREAIFAPYMSTKSGCPSTGGTGLGLTIARHHVESHGGRIEVESPNRGGALFRVVLPVERRRHP